MIDLKHKTSFIYTNSYKGENIYKIIAFPNFNIDTFPLILIREEGFIVIFNIKLKEYFKVVEL